MDLHKYDLVIINTSTGKDSLATTWEICEKHFKDVDVIQIIKDKIANPHLSCEIIEASGVAGLHKRIKGVAIKGEEKIPFEVKLSVVLKHLNKKGSSITEKMFIESGANYQTAFIKGYLESIGKI